MLFFFLCVCVCGGGSDYPPAPILLRLVHYQGQWILSDSHEWWIFLFYSIINFLRIISSHTNPCFDKCKQWIMYIMCRTHSRMHHMINRGHPGILPKCALRLGWWEGEVCPQLITPLSSDSTLNRERETDMWPLSGFYCDHQCILGNSLKNKPNENLQTIKHCNIMMTLQQKYHFPHVFEWWDFTIFLESPFFNKSVMFQCPFSLIWMKIYWNYI